MTATKKIVLGVAAFILLIVMWPFVVVDASERGVVLNFGKVQDEVMQPGLHLRMPIVQKVEKFSVQPISLLNEVPVGSDGAITSDNQTIGAETVLFYRYDEALLLTARKDWGKEKLSSLLKTALRESFKEAIGQHTIFEVAFNQEIIRGKVWESLVKKTSAYPVVLTDLRVNNYDWSEEFDKQIAETMNRAQQVKQKEQELLIAEQEAQKKVKNAEADKQAAKLMAEAKELEGLGIKKYNEAVQSNMDLEVKLRQLEIEKIKAEKFNGWTVTPQVYLPFGLDAGQQVNLKP